jgi:hypothetical protein
VVLQSVSRMIHELIWEVVELQLTDQDQSLPNAICPNTLSNKTHIDGLGQKPGLQCDKPVTNVQRKIASGVVYSNTRL